MINIEEKFKERYSNIRLESIEDNNKKIKVSCNKCNHSWPTSIKNALEFYLGCYNCHKGKPYSMDEIKVLRYIHEKYFPNDLTFRHAESGGQHVIRPKEKRIEKGKLITNSFYQCDGFSRKVYDYKDKMLSINEKNSNNPSNLKGTVFEVLGDYFHSNPLFYKPNDISPKQVKELNTYLTHKENYEYTMNRLKHIEQEGYKVFYIWISDFRRFTYDLEKDENVNIFDYMNIEKHKQERNANDNYYLYKGSRRIINDFNSF